MPAEVACLATLAGVPDPAAVLGFDPTGALSIVARAGDPAPGTGSAPGIGEAKFKSFKAVAQAGADVAFLGRLTAGAGAPRTTAATVSGVWVKTASAPLRLVLREGQVIAGHTIKTLVCFAPGAGSPGQGLQLVHRAGCPRAPWRLHFSPTETQAVVLVDPDNASNTRILSQSGQTGCRRPRCYECGFCRLTAFRPSIPARPAPSSPRSRQALAA